MTKRGGEGLIWRNHIVRHIMCMSFLPFYWHFVDACFKNFRKIFHNSIYSRYTFSGISCSWEVNFVSILVWDISKMPYDHDVNFIENRENVMSFRLTLFNGCARYEIYEDRKYFHNLWHFMVGKILAELAFLVPRQFWSFHCWCQALIA